MRTAETRAPAPYAQLRLWQLVSPALPVGAYSYSQGLETAVESGWVRNEQQALAWIGGHLCRNSASFAPVHGRQRRNVLSH
jgi:urease accessory protein UreF